MSHLRILTIGDVVGPAALDVITQQLFSLRTECAADLIIVNGENAAPGNGIDIPSAKALLSAGADVITTGNHVWQKHGIRDFLSVSDSLLRPANYPAACPGSGYTVVNVLGYRFLVINAQGTVFMDALDSPFDALDRILEREEGRYDFSVLDFHAEATSEKLAMGYYLDGRVNIVVGTHTHVPTADLRVLPGGTGYITDLGMTGPCDSVLGVRREIIIEKFRTRMPVRFEISDNPIMLSGALFTLDTESRRICETEQIFRQYR